MEILIYLAVYDDEIETAPSKFTNLNSCPYIICIMKNLKKSEIFHKCCKIHVNNLTL